MKGARMSRTFKDQPWKVKAAKWNASNAIPHHTHHSYQFEYADAVDRDGNVIYQSGVEVVQHCSYGFYKREMERLKKVPVELEKIPHKPLDTRHDSHEEKLWFQRVRIPERSKLFANTTYVLMERKPYHRPVQVRVEREFICSINETPSAENHWGDYLPCVYIQRAPLGVMFPTDRIMRRRHTVRANRYLSRKEMRELEKHHNAGYEIDDDFEATDYVVLRANDWLG